jgi:hypothetical protein
MGRKEVAPLLQQVCLYAVNENADTVPSHVSALVMEIEILVADFRQVQLHLHRIQFILIQSPTDTNLGNITFKGLFNRLLVSLLIYQID